MANQAKKLVKEELETQIREIERRFQRQIERELDKINEQLRIITSSTRKIAEVESRFQRQVNRELDEIRRELSVIAASTTKLEGELSDRWNILVKLRGHSYDKLMSEYKRVEEKILLDKKASEDPDKEIAEI